MDRNNMRSYVSSGTRSLPHMGKRHSGNGHGGNGHGGNGHSGNSHSGNGHSGNGHSGNGHSARLSPPVQPPSHNNHQEDLINYIYDSWNKVTRELERGSDDAKYYQEVLSPRQLANFRPFDLEKWWGCRLVQNIARNKHRS